MVMCSTVGDVMISKSMKKVGDIGELRRHAGLRTVIRRIAETGTVWVGLLFMSIGCGNLAPPASSSEAIRIADLPDVRSCDSLGHVDYRARLKVSFKYRDKD